MSSGVIMGGVGLSRPGAGALQGGFDDRALALDHCGVGVLGVRRQVGQLGGRLGRQPLVVFAALALDAQGMEGIAVARLIGLLGAPCLPARLLTGDRHHRDAVHRAGRHAQFAAGALIVDHRVHALGGADDAVHWAGLDAQRAADAPGFVDDGQGHAGLRARNWLSSGRTSRPVRRASRTTPSAPPGGQRLMSAWPTAMASA